MSNDAAQVVVGANGSVWVAATSGGAPTDVATPLDGDWTDLGFISEDGATFTEGKDITDIGAWQSFYPIRRIITGRSIQLSFALRQWNKDTIEFALGGAVEENTGEFKYTPPSPEEFEERAVILEWADGTKAYRLYMPRGIVSESVETSLVRTAAADLPVTFAATDPGAGVDAYTLFTDDPAFAAASS
jgi:hypothetical protein